MTALARFCAIIHLKLCLTTRWLAGNCHILADYNWYVHSMRIMNEDLETAIEAIEEEGYLIMKEEFITIILQGIMDELPPFEKYWTHMFQNKSIPVVGECQSKVFHSLDYAMRYYHQRTTQTNRYLPI